MDHKYGKKMMFDRPASDFREAFPLGNGRMGAMVFGGITKERIILNESSLWSGSDSYEYPEDVYKVLPQITELVMKGEYKKAQNLYEKEFLAYRPMPMDGANCSMLPYGCMQTLGELDLYFFQFASGCNQEWYPYEMARELDFEEAVVNYKHRSYWATNTPGYDKGITYQRKAFVSTKGECFAMKLTANKAGSISFNAQLNRTENFFVEPVGNDALLMTGQLSDGKGGGGVKYACLLKVVANSGSVRTENTVLKVRGADDVVIYITAATDMKYYGSRNCEDEKKAVFADMEKAVDIGWEELLEDNIRENKKYFDRCSLTINVPDEEVEALPMDKRLIRKGKGENDDGLIVLMYNYGRYLLISSSRPDGMPLGILGIWGEEIQSPFNGDYHVNAQEITYWSAECCNMPELHTPYLKLAEAIQASGTKTAKAFYNSKGWVTHTFTNPWLFTLPGGEPHWGATITGGAWLCVHLWEHYLYSEDREYLKWAYPIMKGSAEFLLDRLVVDPETGKKVIFPGNSPENIFVDKEGNEVSLCMGTTYDMSITKYLFNACLEASKILDIDNEFAGKLQKEINEIAPIRIGSDGRIMEWQREHVEAKPYHRHISPLWGAFPGDLISVEETPELADGCVKLIEKRTFTGHTWAMMHRAGVLARLYRSQEIYDILNRVLYYGISANLLCHQYFTVQDEKTPETDLQDPFSYNCIFELDGNMGYSAVVVEMLMQSHKKAEVQIDGEKVRLNVIHLLCALPKEWESGEMTGHRARGGFTVEVQWSESRLKRAVIRGKKGSMCIVRYGSKEVVADFKNRETIQLTGDLLEV